MVICLAGWAPTLAVSIAADYFQLSAESLLAAVVIAIMTILPFAVAAAGMVWLLRGTVRVSAAVGG